MSCARRMTCCTGSETAERLPPGLIQRFDRSHRLVRRMRSHCGRRSSAALPQPQPGGAPAENDLSALNAALARAPARRRVQPGGWDIVPRGRHVGSFPAGTCAMVGGRPAGGRPARTGQAMRQSAMRLAVPRQQQERQSPLVLDERLRQPRQGASTLFAAEGEVTGPQLQPCSCANLTSTSVQISVTPRIRWVSNLRMRRDTVASPFVVGDDLDAPRRAKQSKMRSGFFLASTSPRIAGRKSPLRQIW